ncbi:MAG: 2-oxoacid:acceptor oxidoreductase family protein [Desulfobacterales bacterium]|nr:2-oxoacid:acceptor oxidoreductase family protein [Desulfobacterales bacterium]
MEEKSNSRTDVIMAGLGGMGVLIAGQILAWAALKKYQHVSWLPSYGVEKRGGLCECTVIFSDQDIASPLIDRAQTVVVFDGSQLKTFEPRVLPGGMILVESSGLEDEQERRDYELVKIPGVEIAVSMGIRQVSNLILLGAYISIRDAMPSELIEKELGRRFGTKKTILECNQKAFRQGLELGRNAKK